MFNYISSDQITGSKLFGLDWKNLPGINVNVNYDLFSNVELDDSIKIQNVLSKKDQVSRSKYSFGFDRFHGGVGSEIAIIIDTINSTLSKIKEIEENNVISISLKGYTFEPIREYNNKFYLKSPKRPYIRKGNFISIELYAYVLVNTMDKTFRPTISLNPLDENFIEEDSD